MSIELLNCPCCDGEAHVVHKVFQKAEPYSIGCNCGMQTRFFPTLEEAADIWNACDGTDGCSQRLFANGYLSLPEEAARTVMAVMAGEAQRYERRMQRIERKWRAAAQKGQP